MARQIIKKVIQPCWVTYGRTESGDDLHPFVFLHEPTKKEVEKKYKKLYPDEYEYNGFVSFWIVESEVEA